MVQFFSSLKSGILDWVSNPAPMPICMKCTPTPNNGQIAIIWYCKILKFPKCDSYDLKRVRNILSSQVQRSSKIWWTNTVAFVSSWISVYLTLSIFRRNPYCGPGDEPIPVLELHLGWDLNQVQFFYCYSGWTMNQVQFLLNIGWDPGLNQVQSGSNLGWTWFNLVEKPGFPTWLKI